MNRLLDLIRRHGALNSLKIVLARLAPFKKYRYLRAKKFGKVYLGEYLSARQGLWARHYFIDQVVSLLPKNEAPQILEVGCWAGGTTLVFANALKNYHKKGHVTCVDIWEVFYDNKVEQPFNLNSSHMKSVQSGKIFELFKHNIKVGGIDSMVGYHKTPFEKFETDKKFDLIYLDGDHRYKAVIHDLIKADGLLKEGGFLCGDDLEKQYHAVDQKFCDDNLTNDFVYEPNIARTHIHPGVTKAVHEFFGVPVSEYEGFFVMVKTGPSKYKNVTLSLNVKVSGALKIFKIIKYYIHSFMEFKSLYSFIGQKILITSKLFMRIDPPYAHEKFLVYDEDTESVVKKINSLLEKKHCSKNLKFNSKWKNVFQREEIGNTVINSINDIVPISRNKNFSTVIKNLETNGYAALPEKNLTTDEVGEVLQYLGGKKLFPSHVTHRSLGKPTYKEVLKNNNNRFGSYDIHTILGSRVLAKLVGDEEIINLIGNYFGCLPTLAHMNLYWSFLLPDSDLAGPQHYHRDVDDHRIVNVFINLTDSSENDGAYCHIDKTHNLQQLSKIFDTWKRDTVPDKINPFGRPLTIEDLFELPLKGYGFDHLYDHLFKDHVRQVFGPAGTIRCADGYGVHRAIPPSSRDRLIFWLTFSLTRSSTEIAGVPHQKRVRYSQVRQQIENTSLNKYVLRNAIDFRK